MAVRPEPSLTRRAFSGALWTASGWGLSAVFQLAFGIAIARLLGPEILGVYAAALVVVRFSNVFGSIGIGPALVQRETIDRDHLRTGMTLSVGLSIGIAALAWLGAPAIASFYRMPELDAAIRVMALVFPLRGLAVVPQAMLQRELKFRRLAAIEAAAYLLGFGVVAVSLATAGFGLQALVVATLAHAAFELALLWWARPVSAIPQTRWSAMRDLLGYGGGVTLVGVFGFLAFQGDKLIVGRALGASALGLYSRAFSLVSTSTRLYQKIATTAFFPLLSRVQDDRERLGRGFRRGLALNALSVLPMSAVLFVLAPSLIYILLGTEWLGAVDPFRILVLFLFLRSAAKLCGPVVMAAGKVYRLAIIQGVFAALVLVGSFLGSRWGIGGVAAGVAGAIVGHSFLLLGLSLRLTDTTWAMVLRAWVRPTTLAILAAGATWLLVRAVEAWLPVPLVVVSVTLLCLALSVAAALGIAPRLLLGDDALEALRQLPYFRAFEARIRKRFGKAPA